jgi:hypothetical protein
MIASCGEEETQPLGVKHQSEAAAEGEPTVPSQSPAAHELRVDINVRLCCCRKEDAQTLGVKGPDEAAAEDALAVHAPLAIACWRGRASVNLLVNKAEAKQLAEKLRYAMTKRDAPAPHAADARPQPEQE